MRRRTMAIGITVIALTCCGAVAVLASTAPASAGNSTETTAVAGPVGSPGHASPVVDGMFEMQGGPDKPGPNGGTQTRPLWGRHVQEQERAHDHRNRGLKRALHRAGSRRNLHGHGALPADRTGNPNGTRSDPPCAGPKTVVVVQHGNPAHTRLLRPLIGLTPARTGPVP